MTQFVRWVPRAHAPSAVEAGLIAHNTSALWIFDLHQGYRPGTRISHGSILIAYDMDQTAIQNITTRDHINFEDETFQGEAAHPRLIIVKNNEPGAYGIGKFRQSVTNFHTQTRYATKREVAQALGVNERSLGRDSPFRPPTGWP